MAFFDRFFSRKSRDAQRDAGNEYFATYDSQRPLDPDEDDFEPQLAPRFAGNSPDYDTWDAQLGSLDSAVASEERRRRPVWHPGYWRGRRKRWWAVQILAGVLLALIVLVLYLTFTAPLSKSLEPIAPPQITLLASDGTPIARRGANVDAPVDLDTLPDHVPQAFIAIEDRRFYSHWGVDPRGIARAAWTGRGGGSTITQQLAKFTFLSPEQTLSRKAREALIALWIETWLTKEEILERYLSNAYFGDNQYGLRAASLHYFYRKPENLTKAQAAMLAGLLQAPSRYAPTRHYNRAKARMDLVVAAMVEVGYLTEAEAAALPAPKIDSRTVNDVPTGTYFADWALPIARARSDTGYAKQTLTTTLDARLQRLASRAVGRAKLGSAQVGLVAMRPSGEVVAMIGGKDYAKSAFNRAVQARRQPGSTFKLFVYLAALEAGMSPEDMVDNTAIETGTYRPRNSDGRYSDEITLEEAFARSSNVAALRLFNKVGSERVIRTARSMGVASPLPEGDPSLALGTSTMTLLELTSAYAGVAGNAFPVEPHAFAKPEQSWLDWLTSGEDSLSMRHHAYMQQMLRTAINKGTGRAATLPIANYGKTGTTQNSRDAVFVGYAGEGEEALVVGVWVGNDDSSPMDGVSGGGLPARIWKDFMIGALALKKAPPAQAPDPDGPVQPLDTLKELLGLGDGDAEVEVESDEEGVTFKSDDLPVELRLDEDGPQIRLREKEPAD
ncbi:MAG: transglycosylase domain-containing protein [Pseudomonadota bacterium]